MNKWITVQEYQKRSFTGKPPAQNTIRGWCAKGELPAKKIGGTWLINAKVLEQTGNDLADMIINSH